MLPRRNLFSCCINNQGHSIDQLDSVISMQPLHSGRPSFPSHPPRGGNWRSPSPSNPNKGDPSQPKWKPSGDKGKSFSPTHSIKGGPARSFHVGYTPKSTLYESGSSSHLSSVSSVKFHSGHPPLSPSHSHSSGSNERPSTSRSNKKSSSSDPSGGNGRPPSPSRMKMVVLSQPKRQFSDHKGRPPSPALSNKRSSVQAHTGHTPSSSLLSPRRNGRSIKILDHLKPK